ncbi:MAG TPA: hypothetical protein VFA54_14175 [Bryobacterales bacterium]|jgi:hypothetical protein|nr:hypothetical protein [Bryobacterales bacterium]
MPPRKITRAFGPVIGFLFLLRPYALAQDSHPSELHDPAVIQYFRQGGHQRLAHFTTLLRHPVEASQDLLLVWGGVQAPSWTGAGLWWNQTDVMGLFLQEREHPQQVHLLALLLNDDQSCAVEVARIAPGELVLWRTGEKGGIFDSIKFFFDARSRRIFRRIEYAPFTVRRILMKDGVLLFLAGGGNRLLVIRLLREAPAGRIPFQVLSEKEAAPLLAEAPLIVSSTASGEFGDLRRAPASLRFGPGKRFALEPETTQSWGTIWRTVTERAGGRAASFMLPQSSCVEYVQARREAMRRTFPVIPAGTICQGSGPEILETIGAWEIAGDGRLWLGKTFYDAEGSVGVGGFGYFDPGDREFHIFSPPEVRDWSVSALRVGSDAVWLGLMHRGEYGDSPGGLLRWDRSSHAINAYSVSSIVHDIALSGSRIYLAAASGIFVLENGRLQQYIVDVGPDGGYEVVPR